MKNAEMKVVKFSAEDVIATSGLTLSGFGNGQIGDATSLSNYATVQFFTNRTEGDLPEWGWSASGQQLMDGEEAANMSAWNGRYEYHDASEYFASFDGEDFTYSDAMGSGWYWISQ